MGNNNELFRNVIWALRSWAMTPTLKVRGLESVELFADDGEPWWYYLSRAGIRHWVVSDGKTIWYDVRLSFRGRYHMTQAHRPL